MRADLNTDRIRNIKLVAYVGRHMTVNIPNEDSARDPENLLAYTAFGHIVDETETEILDLTPTAGDTNGLYKIDKLIPAGTTPGWYRWRGGVTDGSSAGDDEVRYEGVVHLRTY
jgi:hypothetical protein